MKRLRTKLTYANVMATIAVFIALGGASYAAIKLPRNSVGTEQIKNGAVTGAKIKNGALTGTKIAPGSITGADVDSGSLGPVPNATHAAGADHADAANSANTAGSAADADALQGMPAAAFAKSTAAVSGAASYGQPTPQPIISLPGFEIATKAGGSGPQLIVTVTGTDEWRFYRTGLGVELSAPTSYETEIEHPLHYLEPFFAEDETRKVGWSITCLEDVLAHEDLCTAAGG